jgi:hypothetical protein
VSNYDKNSIEVGVEYVSHIEKKPRLRAIENKVLRRIFGPTREDGTRRWRKLRTFYSSTNIVSIMNSSKIR